MQVSLSSTWLEFIEFIGCFYSCLYQVSFSDPLTFFSLFFSWDFHNVYNIPSAGVPQVTQVIFPSFFLPVPQTQKVIVLSSSLLILFFFPFAQICMLIPLVNFSFQLLYLLVLEFLFGYSLSVLSLIHIPSLHASFSLLSLHVPLFFQNL